MIAANLISHSIIPLRTSDSGKAALLVMNDFNVYHLPVVNHEELLGVLSEEDIMNNSIDEPIGSYRLMEGVKFAQESDHLFEIMRLLVHQDLTSIPVVNSEKKYLGVIRLKDLLIYFAESHSLSEIGSTIIVKIGKLDYSLADLCRIIEGENAHVLASFLTEIPDSTDQLFVTLKIDRIDPTRIIKALERYDYTVEGNYSDSEESEDFYQDRFDSFMHYLNL